ncbi:MAG TPA: hypothetical protein VFL15_11690 [Gammaproteobacteria bacterium]|nr:hypothetical protein [Gammaproteobacteria bacterium]
MNKPFATAAALATALMLAACGSRPTPQPATITSSRDAMTLGMQAYMDDRYLEARNYFERALVEYRSVDNAEGQLDALVDLADSALGQGEYQAARTYLRNADSLLVKGNYSVIAAHVSLLHAYADMQAGDDNAALTRLDTLLNTSNTPDNVTQSALFARTQVAFDLDAADSAQWLGKLGSSLDKRGGALVESRYQRLQALAARKQGDVKHAAALYENALQGYRDVYYRPGIAATLEEWAGMSAAGQQWASARDRLRRALDIRLWLYDRNHAEKDLEKLAEVDAKLGNAAAAAQDRKLAGYLMGGGNPAQMPDPLQP